MRSSDIPRLSGATDVPGHLPERFVPVRTLERSEAGDVYEVEDRERGTRVALTLLPERDAAFLVRFQRAFRARARLSHPNLVTLYDLDTTGSRCLFTRELVEGEDFMSYARRCDPGRLREAVRQLARALIALHQSGLRHGALEPAKVLVTAGARVVLLHLHAVDEPAHDQPAQDQPAQDQPAHGDSDPALPDPARAYRSPEQVRGAPLTPASDWYAVGLLLYQALSGRLPAPPNPSDAGSDALPQPLSALAPDAPADLSALAMDLLAPDPTARPRGLAVLRRLTTHRPKSRRAPSARPLRDDGPPPLLFDRDRELAALREALMDSQDGQAQIVLVHGPVGAGKSALIQAFLDELDQPVADSGVVAVAGACHTPEHLPYQGLADLVADLARTLRELGADLLPTVLPPGFDASARVFPPLARLHKHATRAQPAASETAPHELRLRAFDALRRLLDHLAAAYPTVLVIDDLQWMDADTMSWLAHIICPPAAPPLLFIGALTRDHSDGGTSAEVLAPLYERLTRPSAGRASVVVTELHLAPLTPDASRAAAATLLADAAPDDAPGLAADLAQAAAGDPLRLTWLARRARAAATTVTAGDAATTEDCVLAAVADLSGPARRLLEVIATAGRPLPRATAIDAAGMAQDGPDALSRLSQLGLVRVRPGSGGAPTVDTDHAVVRSALLAALPADRRAQLHRRLARALLRQGAAAEWLYLHFRGSGEQARAAHFAEEAGDRAAAGLAFGHAAERYGNAVELGTNTWRLHEKRAAALVHAGRGLDAADAYLDALAAAPPPLRVPEIRRHAAEQLLRFGHIDRGRALLDDVLAEVGLRLALTRWGALFRAATRRAWLRLRGLGFRPRPVDECDPRALLELDLSWSTSILLSMVDLLHGADFHSRHLYRALILGEPHRVGRALASEVAYTAAPGHARRRRARDLVDRARAMAEALDDAYLADLTLLSEAIAMFLADNDWARAVDLLDRADEALSKRNTGTDWERNTAMIFTFNALYWLGYLGELTERYSATLSRAHARGDRYAQSALECAMITPVLLAADRPTVLRERLDEAARVHSHSSPLSAWWVFISQCEVDLYERRGRECLRRVRRQWNRWRGSFVFQVQLSYIVSLYARARAAVSAAATGRGPRQR
ncbi:AAA family ATPase [Haliangium sp.]|uniref:AAA family ATPase n=1 Tax=Haliangium sp. TaxID=2663208 RepID=UPI003D10D8C6